VRVTDSTFCRDGTVRAGTELTAGSGRTRTGSGRVQTGGASFPREANRLGTGVVVFGELPDWRRTSSAARGLDGRITAFPPSTRVVVEGRITLALRFGGAESAAMFRSRSFRTRVSR
jgi:hypothetical protein